jgi:hypothetical protein
MNSTPASIRINEPKLLTASAAAIVNAFGLFLALPIFLAVLSVTLVKVSLWTFLFPVLVILATAYFLPFGLGNAYVAKLVRMMHPVAGAEPNGFIVQLTTTPRIRSGMRALLEDADDIGYLTFTDSDLRFQGDSIQLSIPLDEIKEVRAENIGMRGLFVYGRRITVVPKFLPNVAAIRFAERSSWLLPTSKAITKRLFARLSSKLMS